MFFELMTSTFIFWMITYVLIIRQNYKDKTYGMPMAALCANISWEFIFSFVYPHGRAYGVMQASYFLLDCVLLIQLLYYGPKEFPKLPKPVFYALTLLTLATAYRAVIVITLEMDNPTGSYAAFAINMMMSILFMAMLYHRQSMRGQSIWIAVCKMLGTTSASLAFFFYSYHNQDSLILPYLFATSFIFDLLYIVQIKWFQRTQELRAVVAP